MLNKRCGSHIIKFGETVVEQKILTHLEVRVEALMLKNTDFASAATALANKVFPLPGGPNSSKPLAGERSPEKFVT